MTKAEQARLVAWHQDEKLDQNVCVAVLALEIRLRDPRSRGLRPALKYRQTRRWDAANRP